MRVLVTGASGFLGRHLVTQLRQRQDDVHRLSAHSASRAHTEHAIESVQDRIGLTSLLKRLKPDIIYHLAGTSNPQQLEQFGPVNMAFAKTLFESIRLAPLVGVPTLVVGSAAEYGVHPIESMPLREETAARPVGPYGFTKYGQTLISQSFHSVDHPIVIARLFNVVGAGMPSHLSLANFARQLLDLKGASEHTTLRVGNLDTSRDYLLAKTVIDAFIRLVQEPRSYGQVVNICSGTATPIRDLLKQLMNTVGIHPITEVDSGRLKSSDTPIHYGSNQRLLSLIGPLREADLSEGIRDLVRHLHTA